MSEPSAKRAKESEGAAATDGEADFVFPFDLSQFHKLSIDPFSTEALDADTKAKLESNIALCRDVIVWFTSCGSARGYGGHTGGAFDTVPEVMLMDAFFNACPDKFVKTFFDEAGHRVATQYLLAALKGHIDPAQLRFYRKGHSKLPGHPELGMTPGIEFSSGRLGHMWPMVNGVAYGNPDKAVFCLGSDGSQMEGNDAEAARLAVSESLNVKLIIDDNDVTITGHPSQFLKGYSVEKTLEGHGMPCRIVKPEDGIDVLFAAMRAAITTDGPFAVICKRPMCPGIEGVEGTNHGHDAVAPAKAIPHLESRGHPKAAAYIKSIKKSTDSYVYRGCGKVGSNRGKVGETIVALLGEMTAEERKAKVMVIDSDLGGSTGVAKVEPKFPEVYVHSGIMERGNYAAAAGFGMEKGKQGIFSTFAAFLEMCISEITMARLNNANVLSHFSHSGTDDMADNTCHFGLNNLFADNGLEDGHPTRLYFPADVHQVEKCVRTVFPQEGLRFVFTTRSKTPEILKADGTPFYGDGYEFMPGVDDFIFEGTAGYVLAFGDALYRAVDAVTRLREEGIDVGLVNKATLNVVDEAAMAKYGAGKFLLIVEPLNKATGLGSKMGTWLLERGLAPKLDRIGVHHEGSGGLWEHAYHQGYNPESIISAVKKLV